MMRKILLFIVFLVPWSVYSQINQTGANGLRQGRWQKTWPNGNLIYEGTFEDGKPVGKWTRYHEKGQVKAKIQYIEGSDSASARLFSPRGEKVAEGIYVNKKKEGKWVYYSSGVKISEVEYHGGRKHGVSRQFYPSGKVLEEAEWEDGKREGKYQVFYKNGEPYMQCKFHKGKRNGLCLSYYKNNRVEMEAGYEDNLRHGEWKFFNEAGEYLYSLEYKKGELLNPGVRDSIDNVHIQKMEKGRESIPDPEKFMQAPSEYMQMQNFR